MLPSFGKGLAIMYVPRTPSSLYGGGTCLRLPVRGANYGLRFGVQDFAGCGLGCRTTRKQVTTRKHLLAGCGLEGRVCPVDLAGGVGMVQGERV